MHAVTEKSGTEAEGRIMQEPGQKLRRLRERLRLRYRDVEEASQRIANQRRNREFVIGLSRLADIESKGTLPSLYRLYSLCAIYSLDFNRALSWYGIDLRNLVSDSARLPLLATHPIDFHRPEQAKAGLPVRLDKTFDARRTSYMTGQMGRLGELPFLLLDPLDRKGRHYAFIGTDDWSMYPVIAPGSFLQIDSSKRKVAKEGWASEHERPIYFLEHRDGYFCGWCTEIEGHLVVQPHPAYNGKPEIFKYPQEIEVMGQVVAVATRLDLGKRRHRRS